MKIITLKKLNASDIIQLLMARMVKERKQTQRLLNMQGGELWENLRKHSASDAYLRHRERETEALVRDLQLHPWDRLKEDLDFWIGTQVGQANNEYSMLPWLEKAKWASTVEEALIIISDMHDALGDCIPESLDITTDRWCDVTVQEFDFTKYVRGAL
jgi:hypothetical protein|tara:strand:+ start:138 stop:611 length:474 start_codon:yes stop_codon:yes gene_type:complete